MKPSRLGHRNMVRAIQKTSKYSTLIWPQATWFMSSSFEQIFLSSVIARKQQISSIDVETFTHGDQGVSGVRCTLYSTTTVSTVPLIVCSSIGWASWASLSQQPGKAHSEQRNLLLKGVGLNVVPSYDSVVQSVAHKYLLPSLTNLSGDPASIIER